MRKKVLLILGASSDMGIAFIESEIGNYDYIIAHYHNNANRLLHLKKRYPPKMHLMKADLSNIEEVLEFADNIKKGFIPNYIIHFPAVKCKLKRFEKIAVDEFEENMRVSVNSIVVILQNILPFMVKNHYGKIVFILSIHTIADGHKYISDYVTAKYALLGLMKSLTIEYKDQGIRINGVSPDTVDTKFISELPRMAIEIKKNKYKSKKLMGVSDVIPTIAYLLDEASDCLFGQNIGLTQE